MEFGSVAAVAGVVFSVLFSSAALLISIRNSKDTRAYKDPMFVLECVPMVLDSEASPDVGQGQIMLKLINQGDSFASDVEAVAEFDPFGLFVPKGTWPFVERSGGHVLWPTSVDITNMSAGVLSQVGYVGGRNMCVIKFKSQAGHKCEQSIPLPDIYSFVTNKNDQIH